MRSNLHNACVDFTQKIREMILQELQEQLAEYKTDTMKALVTEEWNKEYLMALERVNRIEHGILSLVDEEKEGK